MKIALARREFLRTAINGLGFMAVQSSLFDSIVSRFAMQALAAATGTQKLNPSGYYIHFTFPGGPPRWMFDLPLTPGGKTANNFIASPGFGTVHGAITGGSYGAEYVSRPFTVAGKTLELPPVWGMDVAGQSFSSVLSHSAFIRGMHMEINNHEVSARRQVAPIIGGLSINGVVADGSDRPIPVIADVTQPSLAFRSQKGLAAPSFSYAENASTDPVRSILTPFRNDHLNRPTHSAQQSLLQEQALAEFEAYAKTHKITGSTLTSMYDHAISLMHENAIGLTTEWPLTVAKYRTICKNALSPNKGELQGVFDRPIAANGTLPFRYGAGTTDFLQMTDMRDMFDGQQTAIRMAENFALAEILIDRVTSNMVLGTNGISNLNLGNKRFTLGHDQHFIGSAFSTMATTLFYRAFLGCLSELVKVLKSRGIFERTVIHVSSEFNRVPITTQAGSDHGFMAGNTTLISGMIQRPTVIGNITKTGYTSTYTGTFGVAANYNLEGFNRPIQVNDVARTITAMLGVPDIVTNGRSLLAPRSGGWVAKKEEADNV